MTERLSRTQRKILLLMHNHGHVEFLAGERKFRSMIDRDGKLLIAAYQTPEYFMQRRGLIESTGKPHCYRITNKGKLALER